MAHRIAPPREPVGIELDGEPIVAERGEPLAFALIAADQLALSRSPKLHRPHGPYCLRGGCDGCLMRVNGEPNVMTCLVPCQGGEQLGTQNVLGSRQIDLMEATDWFFPRGIDHHHFLAGVPAASFVVQKIARHVAGLGKLPDRARPIGRAARREADVLIVGGGPAGLTVARALRTRASERSVFVVDDGVTPGGSLRARGHLPADLSALNLYERATAAGVYEREVLVVREGEALIVRPRALVVATGAHEGVAAFPGNDLPGVVSARAAALLARRGIAIGRKVGLVGTGPYSASLLETLGDAIETIAVPDAKSIITEGRRRVTAMSVRRGERHSIDALVVEVPGPPSFELAEQAGAKVRFDPARGGYVPEVDENGRVVVADGTLPWVWCAGEAAGTGPLLSAIEAQAEKVAHDIARVLS